MHANMSIIQMHVRNCTYYLAFIQKKMCVIESSIWHSHCDCAVFGGCACVHVSVCVCVLVCMCVYVCLYTCVSLSVVVCVLRAT